MPLLADAGVQAVAVDLPGHGADREPLGDLRRDAARVRAELERDHDDVVLVGHSYGGAVVSEAGDHPAVSHVVYLCALALDVGESCVAAATEEAAAAGISHEGRPDVGAGLVPGPDGTVTLDPATAATCFYNDCDADTVAWATARLGPHALSSLEQPATAAAWRSKPASYIVCADDLALHPDLQRVLATRCGTRWEWPTGHSPFLSRPQLVAGMLAELATHPAG